MSKFKDFLPKNPIFMGRSGSYKLYICGKNPPKMMPDKKDIYLSYDASTEPVFGFTSEKFFFGPVITAAGLEMPISKSEYDHYYGEPIKKLANLILDNINLEVAHFFSREVLHSSYPFKFEREETEENGEMELKADYDTMYAYIGDDFLLLHKNSNELDESILYFIAKQVLSVNTDFDLDTADKLALYLSGSEKITEAQLQKILSQTKG